MDYQIKKTVPFCIIGFRSVVHVFWCNCVVAGCMCGHAGVYNVRDAKLTFKTTRCRKGKSTASACGESPGGGVYDSA